MFLFIQNAADATCAQCLRFLAMKLKQCLKNPILSNILTIKTRLSTLQLYMNSGKANISCKYVSFAPFQDGALHHFIIIQFSRSQISIVDWIPGYCIKPCQDKYCEYSPSHLLLKHLSFSFRIFMLPNCHS